MSWLDNTGLSYLWSKITSALAGKLDTTGNAYRALSIPFGKVDSTSTQTAFTATVDGITELRDGVCVYLKNGVVTSAAGFTLNINGLGAKPVYQTLAAATAVTTLFNVNYTMLFVYNSARVSGGCWDMFYGYNASTTYSNMSQTEANTGTAPNARTISAKVLHEKISGLAVRYDAEQSLTAEQQTQARENIGAAANVVVTIENNIASMTPAEIRDAIDAGNAVYLDYDGGLMPFVLDIDGFAAYFVIVSTSGDGGATCFDAVVDAQKHVNVFETPLVTVGALTDHEYNTDIHITSTERAAWNAKADEADIPAIPVNISAFTNDAGYLTEHQDINGKLNIAQGAAHAGEFLIVGSNGNITTVTMTVWQGGNY